jgi:hypothetical protein
MSRDVFFCRGFFLGFCWERGGCGLVHRVPCNVTCLVVFFRGGSVICVCRRVRLGWVSNWRERSTLKGVLVDLKNSVMLRRLCFSRTRARATPSLTNCSYR